MKHIKSIINVIIFILIILSCLSLTACQKAEKSDNNEWWKVSGTSFVCNDDKNKTIEVQIDENRDGTCHLSFFLNVYGGSSCILDSSSDEVTISEENGTTLFSYTGTDIYNDKINIIYSSKDKTLTVTSINELSGGTTNYDLPCSGTYKNK